MDGSAQGRTLYGRECWYLKDISNVHVIHKDSISAWVNNAFAIMHNGCTTALEATISMKPVVTYIPFKQIYRNDIPNRLGHIVNSLEDLSKKVNSIFQATQTESQKKNSLRIKKQDNFEIHWPGIFSDLNLNGISKNLLKQASVIQQENNLKLSFPKNVLSILNEDQKKDIEKSFEDYLKMELVFIYDDEVDSKLTPEYEKKNKDKGIRKNIKKTMEKDKNFNEIMGGLKIESVKFNKKNET